MILPRRRSDEVGDIDGDRERHSAEEAEKAVIAVSQRALSIARGCYTPGRIASNEDTAHDVCVHFPKLIEWLERRREDWALQFPTAESVILASIDDPAHQETEICREFRKHLSNVVKDKSRHYRHRVNVATDSPANDEGKKGSIPDAGMISGAADGPERIKKVRRRTYTERSRNVPQAEMISARDALESGRVDQVSWEGELDLEIAREFLCEESNAILDVIMREGITSRRKIEMILRSTTGITTKEFATAWEWLKIILAEKLDIKVDSARDSPRGFGPGP